jgi:two-component system, NtrC family, response regulator
MKPRLLIVDDDEDIRSQTKWALVSDYDIVQAEDRPSAIAAFKSSQPGMVLLDLGLPPTPNSTEEGFITLAELLKLDRHVKIVVVTGQAEKPNALQAIGEGAYDFLSKPLDVENLKAILKRGFHVAQLEREYHEMQARFSGDTFEGMLGNSPQMQVVFSTIRKVATSDAPVLILGESGTGKEMVAQAIHQCSGRKTGPFVPINCGAIPENLLESELFGHEKGSFTGAHAQRKGRIESAGAGTLFLDEIGELPLALQVKMLRFLQEQTIERVGGRETLHIDTRVIAATNVNLKEAMAAGKFREDLFYRLAVVMVHLPPLRERENDICLLAQAFLQRSAIQIGKAPPQFSQDALRAINQYNWPGNVRELENRVKRSVIMAKGHRISAADLELAEVSSQPQPRTLKEARESLEADLINKALKRHQGKVSAAAMDLGISRPTLYEMMDKFGIKRE